MQTKNMELLVELACAHDDALARAVRAAIQKGIPTGLPEEAVAALKAAGVKDSTTTIVPGKLKQALAEAGLVVSEDAAEHAAAGMQPLAHLVRVLIFDPANRLEAISADEFARSGKAPVLVARGESDSAGNALLHAVLGYLRECDIEQLGYIVPLEFHRKDPAKINAVTLNGKTFSAEQLAALKGYLTRKRTGA